MTTPHDKALATACKATILGEDEDYKPIHLELREAEIAISAYLSSIGGVVCQREPVGYATELELKQLELGATVVDLFRNGVTDSSVVPLHAPISRSEEGSDKL
jgi:hypothetical protein